MRRETILEHVRLTILTTAALVLTLAAAAEAHHRQYSGEPSCLTSSR